MAIVTISTHMGRKVARLHNLREPKVTDKEPHIRKDGHHEVWLDIAPEKAYKAIFGKAVERYNNRQTREDRKVTDYYKQVCSDSKKAPVYEVIVGVYPQAGTLSDKEQRAILFEYAKGWKEVNPNMRMIGCYFHADEQGAPHIHLDYIPVAHGYKRGLDTQSAHIRAIEEQGFRTQGKTTAQMAWTRSENERLEHICKAHGLQVTHPQREKGSEHLQTKAYKAQKELENIEKSIKRSESVAKRAEKVATDKINELADLEEAQHMILFVTKARTFNPDGSIRAVRDDYSAFCEKRGFTPIQAEKLNGELVEDIEDYSFHLE